MKKLYSKFVESRVKQYLLSHEAAPQSRAGDRHLSLVRPESVLWQSFTAKLPVPAATRWIE